MNAKKRLNRIKGASLFLTVMFLAGALVIFQPIPASGNDRQEATQIVEKACMTFTNFMNDEHMSAFRDLLKDAKAVVIAPEFLKGAFVVGASGGNAVALVRRRVERALLLYHWWSEHRSANRRTVFRGDPSGDDRAGGQRSYGEQF